MVKMFTELQEQVSPVPRRVRKKKVKEEEDPAVNYSDVPVSGGSGSLEDDCRTPKKPQPKPKAVKARRIINVTSRIRVRYASTYGVCAHGTCICRSMDQTRLAAMLCVSAHTKRSR